MTDQQNDVDKITGVETTGHEWDGIRELNNPLPRWWLYIFYASVLVSVVYWILMPAWPALPGFQGSTRGILAQSDRASVHTEIATMRSDRAELAGELEQMSFDQIMADPQQRQFTLALGESYFGDNCATCHGGGGGGAPGYPTLADDVWLWGGHPDEIEATIAHGIRSGEPDAHTNDMPAFGRDQFLSSAEIADLVEYVVDLSHGEADAAAVARAAPIFERECTSCHADDGSGGETLGAPNLTDAEWLYGGDRATIQRTIYGPRGGVMPAWRDRLDPATVRALAIYVHSLGGGE